MVPVYFSHKVYTWSRSQKKIRRDSSWWWWRTIRRKMATRPNFGGHNSEVMDLELRKCHQINRNHSVSQTPEGVRSSYSGVSKYSPVLQNCKVWAPSDHWWWRYINFYFCRVSHCVANNSLFLLNTMDVEVFKFLKNTIRCISITSGRMEPILCSLVVLVSTSKPQSMSSELLLVSDLQYDFGKFINICADPKPSSAHIFFRISATWPCLTEYSSKTNVRIALLSFLAFRPRMLVYRKKY